MSVDLKQFGHHEPGPAASKYKMSTILETYSRAAETGWYVKGCEVCVARLYDPPGWFIIPMDSHDDDQFENMGPFPAPEAAITAVLLMNEA